MKIRAKVYSCKIGTIPSLVVLTRRNKIAVGCCLTVRDAKHGSKPFRVRVTRVDPVYFTYDTPYFFAEKI